MKKKYSNIIYQVLGVFFYTFGVAGIVFTGLGSSPIDAATYFINELLPIFNNIIPSFTGQGIWLIIFNMLIALFLFTVTKERKLIYNVLISIIVGFLFNFAMFLYGKMFSVTGIMTGLTHHLALRIILAIIFINFMSLGIAILAAKRLYSTPYDELTIYTQQKVNKYFLSKIILDGTFLLIAFLLGLIGYVVKVFTFSDITSQIGFFTIVVLVALGPLINIYINLVNKIDGKED